MLFSTCRRQAEESPLVAQVYDYELHKSDLAGLVGEGVSAEDSVLIVNNYIEQWVRQSVLLAKAEKNVSDDFSRQMREYRNSLLTYAYERQIVDQLLDTVVSDEEIADYYALHKEEFPLKSSIVKVVYVTAPAKSPVKAKLKALLSKQKFDEDDIVDLERMAARNGFEGYYDANVWLPFFSLQSMVPITTYNEDLFLKHNRYVTLSDDTMSYFVRFLDYKVTDEVSPLELQQNNIKSIILNHRRVELLAKLQADLLKEAEEGGHVKRNV